MKDKFYFQWHITNLCNLRCRHCYQDDFSSKAELDWAGLKKVCDNVVATLKNWGTDASITVTGGEPLAKRELFLLLEYLSNNERIAELNIITNLTLLNDSVIARLKTIPKLKSIKFSLEGMSPQKNDYIRGEGSFKKILKALQLLKKYQRFELHLMFTVLRRNIKDIPKIFSFVKEQSIDGFILERFIPIGQSAAIKDEVLTKKDWKELTDMLLEFCQLQADKKDILTQRAFWIKAQDSTYELLGAPCTVASDGLCIMPDATVFPCRRFNLPIGNLLNKDLNEIWKDSDVLNALRKKSNLKGKCRICPIKECRGCRALAYALTGDYLSEDVQCWYDSQKTVASSPSTNSGFLEGSRVKSRDK
ncbi:MAG: radical SAM protein [Candidatus Omnitrophica bacterium]|nr:radical SAM protein [Candidatus Omnitrophota bacterium]